MSSQKNMLVNEFSVRRAGSADVAELVGLMRDFYAESDFVLDLEWAKATFVRLLKDAGLGCVWIAERDGGPAGHAVLTVRYTMEHGALIGYLDDLYVRPDSRRRGIGRALVENVVHECEQRNCKSLSVEVGAENEPALDLYRDFGLVEFQDGRTFLSGAIRAGGA